MLQRACALISTVIFAGYANRAGRWSHPVGPCRNSIRSLAPTQDNSPLPPTTTLNMAPCRKAIRKPGKQEGIWQHHEKNDEGRKPGGGESHVPEMNQEGKKPGRNKDDPLQDDARSRASDFFMTLLLVSSFWYLVSDVVNILTHKERTREVERMISF